MAKNSSVINSKLQISDNFIRGEVTFDVSRRNTACNPMNNNFTCTLFRHHKLTNQCFSQVQLLTTCDHWPAAFTSSQNEKQNVIHSSWFHLLLFSFRSRFLETQKLHSLPSLYNIVCEMHFCVKGNLHDMNIAFFRNREAIETLKLGDESVFPAQEGILEVAAWLGICAPVFNNLPQRAITCSSCPLCYKSMGVSAINNTWNWPWSQLWKESKTTKIQRWKLCWRL